MNDVCRFSVVECVVRDDGRSISRNVTNINKLVQEKTELFFQNILQHRRISPLSKA